METEVAGDVESGGLQVKTSAENRLTRGTDLVASPPLLMVRALPFLHLPRRRRYGRPD